MAGLAEVEDLLSTRTRGKPLPVLLVDAEMGGQIVEHLTPRPGLHRMHPVFLDHPVEKPVPLLARHALLDELLEGMAGGAVEIDRGAPRALGKAAVVLDQPGLCRARGLLGRRRGVEERAPAGQHGRDDRGRKELPCPSQDAYTEIRCMELFM